jgi:two-component system CheB/CheR fusion protein
MTSLPDEPADLGLESDEAGTEQAFEALLLHLRDSRGFDFSGYKRASLKRRIRHRMGQLHIEQYVDYLDHLQVNPDEFEALFNTILINVTRFFRDPEAWDYLAHEAVPELLAALSPNSPVRVWCAGCASGEEAYTLAIVLCEVMGVAAFRQRVKIYATDVDEDALTTARQAVYGERELNDMTPERLASYFEPQGPRWSFRQDLRRSVIFGRNNLVQDAPISRIDLLLCRNTLMYFTPPTQASILARFHFALAPTGLLMLGKAEMLLSHSLSFEPVDLKRRVFRKSAAAIRGATVVSPAFVLDRPPSAGSLDELREHAFTSGPVAQIVLTGDDVLAMVNQQAEAIFGVSARDIGRPLRDLEVSYRPTELRSVVEKVRVERRPQRITDVRFERPGLDPLWFEVQVSPLTSGNGALLGVSLVFHDITTPRRLFDDLEQANLQIEASYEELQSTIEELETTNEELQSTIEELETTNEELQSTNEELETTNEELRSTNDELQRLNVEAQQRGSDIDRLNLFLESILASLRSAVIVLDNSMRVTAWNRGAEQMWGLRRDEALGEHLLNLDIGLPVEQLRPTLRSLGGGDGNGSDHVFAAVNRRGRPVEVKLSANRLASPDGAATGIILVMQ